MRDVNLTRMNIFSIHLLVGCDDLECDAACFRSRSSSTFRPQNPSCISFVVHCARMLCKLPKSCYNTARLSFLSIAPASFRSRFCIVFFLQQMRDTRASYYLTSKFGLTDNTPFAEARNRSHFQSQLRSLYNI